MNWVIFEFSHDKIRMIYNITKEMDCVVDLHRRERDTYAPGKVRDTLVNKVT